jgi:hypothetical protein
MSAKVDLKDLDEGLSLYITNEGSRTLYKQESSNAIEEMHRIDGLLQLPEENFEENMHKEFLISSSSKRSAVSSIGSSSSDSISVTSMYRVSILCSSSFAILNGTS